MISIHPKFIRLRIISIAFGVALLAGCVAPTTPGAETAPPATDAEIVSPAPEPARVEAFRFALVADSHSDNASLAKVLDQVKSDGAAFVIHLGDLTRVGGPDELRDAKRTLDAAGLTYYAVPGDHDIVRADGTAYFSEVFGAPYRSFAHGGWTFALLDNSDIDLSYDAGQADWLAASATPEAPKLAFMHNPPQHAFLTAHTMEETREGKAKAAALLQTLQNIGVRHVFAGEMHAFQQYKLDNGLPITVAGAAGTPTNPFGPQYVLVVVYNDASLSAERKPLNDPALNDPSDV
jgi:3',5'-cyclic AMP phosphodiesterase CpdA